MEAIHEWQPVSFLVIGSSALKINLNYGQDASVQDEYDQMESTVSFSDFEWTFSARVKLLVLN